MTNKTKFSEGIGDLIIAMLLSSRSSARFHKIIRQREFARFKKQSIRMTFSRLKKRGYLHNIDGNWSLTQKGKLSTTKNILLSYLSSPFDNNQQQNTIISFDIAETDRAKRNWLRNQIKIFGYKMLQQSLWLGPGPLPIKFLERLNKLNIRKNIKIFSINKKKN